MFSNWCLLGARHHSIYGSPGELIHQMETLKFDGWLWKTIRNLFYTMWSFVCHFKAMGEFKLELQSGNAQFRSKSVIFFSCVTLKFDRWLWKIIGHLFYATMILWIISKPLVNSNWSYSPETLNSGKNRQFFVPCDLEILWITLENTRAPLLYYVKLCDYFKAIGEFKLELQSGYTQFG